MKSLRWLLSLIGSVISALQYELARLRGVRSIRGVVLSALVGSVLLTLLAARRMVGLAHSLPPLPHPSQPYHALPSLLHPGQASASLAVQIAPTHGGGAWVIAGGVVGMVLPGLAAAVGAAWFGATSVGYEYRYGNGLLTFTLVPRRGCVLVAKAIVAAALGALLCLATAAVAYGTARLGFRIAGTHIDLPVALLVPGPRAVALAAVGGALGVIGGAVLRLRVLATVVAVVACGLVAAFLPRSTSLVIPYLIRAVQDVVRVVPGVTYAMVVYLLLTLPLAALVLSGLVAVRRRRVV